MIGKSGFGLRNAYNSSMKSRTTPAEIELVRAVLQGKAPGPLGLVAKRFGIAESSVASSLPADQSHGVAASHFQAVRKSIEQWEDAVTLITRGDSVADPLLARVVSAMNGPVGRRIAP